MVDTASALKEQVKDFADQCKICSISRKTKVKENVRDLTSSISQTKVDRARTQGTAGTKAKNHYEASSSEMEQVKQRKTADFFCYERPTTRQEQYHG